jgi:hypothetical protein
MTVSSLHINTNTIYIDTNFSDDDYNCLKELLCKENSVDCIRIGCNINYILLEKVINCIIESVRLKNTFITSLVLHISQSSDEILVLLKSLIIELTDLTLLSVSGSKLDELLFVIIVSVINRNILTDLFLCYELNQNLLLRLHDSVYNNSSLTMLYISNYTSCMSDIIMRNRHNLEIKNRSLEESCWLTIYKQFPYKIKYLPIFLVLSLHKKYPYDKYI